MDTEISGKMMELCRRLSEMLEMTFQAFRKSTETSIKNAEETKKEVQRYSSELTRFLVGKSSASTNGKEWVKPYLSIVSSFDRMGYNIDGILDRLKTKVQEQMLFTDRAIKEINDVFQEAMSLLENLPDLILTQNKLLAQQMGEKGKLILKMADQYSEKHEQRLIEGVCVPKSSPVYLDILFSLKGILVHILEISGKVVTLSARA
jgi:Na+/phosphate symporter